MAIWVFSLLRYDTVLNVSVPKQICSFVPLQKSLDVNRGSGVTPLPRCFCRLLVSWFVIRLTVSILVDLATIHMCVLFCLNIIRIIVNTDLELAVYEIDNGTRLVSSCTFFLKLWLKKLYVMFLYNYSMI